MLQVGAVALLLALSSAKPKLVVLELSAAGDVDPKVASALTESVTSEVSRVGVFDVVAAKDFQTLIGLERQRQLMGCGEDQESCLAELAGALGARFVLSGSVAKLGDSYQLSLQTLDSAKAQPLGRSTRIAPDLGALRAQIPYGVAEATATPPPEPPSRLVPYSLIGGGALSILAGGFVGVQALSQEQAHLRELELGTDQQSVLKPASFYREERSRLSRQKTLSMVLVGLGAGLAGTGVYLYRREPSAPGKASISVATSGTGVTFWGVFQ